jgi:hypothetical protein
MKKVCLIQPLPNLVFDKDTERYSEFPSLGLGILGTLLEQVGHIVKDICYAIDANSVRNAAEGCDTAIVGDFRYYAYFCNPLPLIKRVVKILGETGRPMRVIIAGRHARFMNAAQLVDGQFSNIHLVVCSDMAVLAHELALGSSEFSRLGKETLPSPGRVSWRFSKSIDLPGSRSRSTGLISGQLFTASGCRFNCAFCEKARTPIIPFAKNELEQQLMELIDNNIKYLILWDEVFGQRGTGYRELLQLTRRYGVSFGCNTRQDHITEEFSDELAEGGCKGVLFGVELASQEHSRKSALRLDKGKEPSRERFQSVLHMLKSRGISPVASIIVGLPDDTEETIRDRIQSVKEIGFSKIYARPLVPFPESSYYQNETRSNKLVEYSDWQAEDFSNYPLGYPTVSCLSREQLCEMSQW